MSTRKAWWLYTIIRLGLFAGVFALVYLLGVNGWLSALFAAIISAAISVIALDPLRQKAAEGLQNWRNKTHTDDDVFEDAVVEQDPTVLDISPDETSPRATQSD